MVFTEFQSSNLNHHISLCDIRIIWELCDSPKASTPFQQMTGSLRRNGCFSPGWCVKIVKKHFSKLKRPTWRWFETSQVRSHCIQWFIHIWLWSFTNPNLTKWRQCLDEGTGGLVVKWLAQTYVNSQESQMHDQINQVNGLLGLVLQSPVIHRKRGGSKGSLQNIERGPRTTNYLPV